MKFPHSLIVGAMLAVSCASVVPDVVPRPNVCELSSRKVKIATNVAADGTLAFEADYATRELGLYGQNNKILELAVDVNLGPEEYVLDVRAAGTTVTGGSPAGVFYGIQTLLQEAEAYGGKAYKGVIRDSPRYGWRGYMLDESRHFFGIDNAIQTLDMMARYKMNRFHWHLTDAPGWRIEIKAFPELTTIGAKGDLSDPNAPAQFYTQDEIREVVAYAADRHIEVVPEIDMPGHASSATRTYPVLGVGKAPGSFTYNPGREEVYEFLTKVLGEVCELFPYEYIHIGGDEVFMGSKLWNDDPNVRALMQREGWDDVKEAEAYFLSRMSPVVRAMGKKLIAWDDVLELGMEDATDAISWWRHDRIDHIEQALASQCQLILCPRIPLYLDFVQDSTHTVGRVWSKDGKFCPIDAVYAFPESLFAEWDGDEEAPATAPGILGFQGNLWTETLGSVERAEFMTYPRLCAIAEAAWTAPTLKDYPSFRERLGKEYALYDSLGIFYCDYRDLTRHPEPKY